MIIEEMTMHEFVNGLQQTRTVLLPIGSTEEHGSHLPLGTDTFQALDICVKLANIRPLFVAPTIAYGVCRSTGFHPGTIGITTDALKLLVTDIVTSLYRQGLRFFIIVSGHAGGTHNSALVDVGECLMLTFPETKFAIVTEYDLVREVAGDLIETEGDSHAGEIETSRMLATRAHLVKGQPEAEFPNFPKYILTRDKLRFWPGGIWGDPSKATAAKGHEIETRLVNALDHLVSEVESCTW